ncbi:hypothetical protein L6R29_18745 [Myxococcota bacterium]|nr:hypothetical protein [Myxococcota bacterium]
MAWIAIGGGSALSVVAQQPEWSEWFWPGNRSARPPSKRIDGHSPVHQAKVQSIGGEHAKQIATQIAKDFLLHAGAVDPQTY